jgi:hypothetical protein
MIENRRIKSIDRANNEANMLGNKVRGKAADSHTRTTYEEDMEAVMNKFVRLTGIDPRENRAKEQTYS